jgi:hypothetical protein
MNGTSRRLFRGLPPHVPPDLRTVAWELEHVKEVVQDHQDRMEVPPSPQGPAAPASPMTSLLQHLPAPLVVALLALAAIKDPVAVLKLISW